MRRYLHLFLFFFALVSITITSVKPAVAYPFFFDGKRKQMLLPFKFERNLIIIPLFINGKGPFNFILDTGVTIFIITDPNLSDSIGLSSGRTIEITGLGEGDELEAKVVTGLEIKIGNTTARNMAGAQLSRDAFLLSSYVGTPITGLIGYDFFNSFNIRINYTAQIITVSKSEDYKPRKGFKAIPISIENQKPYIRVETKLNDSTTILSKLVIDTGAGHPISLETDSDPRITIPDTTLNARLGMGLSGPINGYIGRIQKLKLNDIEINNIITSFPNYESVGEKVILTPRNGNLGNDLLKRFTVIFDYPRKVIYIKPNEKFKEPFEHDMTGIELITAGDNLNRYLISNVEPGSPAHDIGLQKDDEIMSINFKPAKDMLIGEIDNLFRSRNGRNILIEVFRDGSSQFIVLTLRRRV